MTDDELTTTLCEIVAAADLGEWRPMGPVYSNPEVGIYYGPIGIETDRGIGVTLYGTTDDDLRNGLPGPRRVQFRFRGAKGSRNGANVIAQNLFDAIHGLRRTSGILLIRRVSSTPLAADGTGRPERADNYEIITDLSGA